MSDAAERRPTGEHPPVVVGNGPTWKWMVGTMITVGVMVAAGVITIKTDITAMQVEIKFIKDTIVTERGMAERHDREIRGNREEIIMLRGKSHRHGR